MPARIDELLSQGLANLPTVDGGPCGWRAVQQKLQRREASAQRLQQAARWSMAASVVVLASVVALNVTQHRATSPAPAVAAVAAPQPVDDIEQLRAQSVALEQLLAALPERPTVMRAETALPIDTLEAQVQWLDHQLSAGDDASPGDERQLWRERVEVMNSLVRLRYAEVQRVAM
jgi:hypothetical protein